MTWSAIVGSWRALVVLALAALVVRVGLYVAWVRHTGGFGDFGFYHEQAKLLAAGKGWIEPYDHAFGVDHASAGHPPLWPLVLSVPALLGFDSIETNRLVGALLGCVVVVLVAVVAARLAGRRAGIVAGGIAAVHPVLIGADLSLLSETLYGLLALLCVLAAIEVHERAATPRAVAWVIAAGVAGGLAGLTRGEGVLLAVLVIAAAVVGTGVRPRRAAGLVGAGVVACALTVAPWTIRNAVEMGGFIPVSTNDSTVVAGANCDSTYSGAQLGGWDLTCIPNTQRPYSDERVLADGWRRRGLDYARAHVRRLVFPVAEVRVLRTFGFWRPLAQTQFAEGQPRRLADVSTFAYYLLVPVALLGLLALRRRRAPWLIPVAVVLAIVVTSAVGWGVPRFRHPVDLMMAVAAGCAVAHWRPGRPERAA